MREIIQEPTHHHPTIAAAAAAVRAVHHLAAAALEAVLQDPHGEIKLFAGSIFIAGYFLNSLITFLPIKQLP